MSLGQKYQHISARPYGEQLSDILGQPVSPENISHYADEALDSLASLACRMSSDYLQEQPDDQRVGAKLETVAFHYFNVDPIEKVIDYLAQKSIEIAQLDARILGSTSLCNVLVPPSAHLRPNITPGDSSYIEKRHFERLKTTLFILQNEFSVDVYDPNQLRLTKGETTTNMMRKESYYSLTIPTLIKQILVCDEEGNATYVFDLATLSGTATAQPEHQNKSYLDELLRQFPHVGTKIIYSPNFTSDLIDALNGEVALPNANSLASTPNQSGQYLLPKAPDGTVSASAIATRHNLNRGVIAYAVENLQQELGDVGTYRFRSIVSQGYDEVQVAKIIAFIEKKGHFMVADLKSKGFLNRSECVKSLGIGNTLLVRALAAVEDKLGDVLQVNPRNRDITLYSPAQIEIVRNFLAENRLLAGPAPEGYVPRAKFSRQLHIDQVRFIEILDSLRDKLGEIPLHVYGRIRCESLSPQQQELITTHIVENGLNNTRSADGTISYSMLAKRLGLADGTVLTAINEITDELGPLSSYLRGGEQVPTYDPQQQALIEDHLSITGRLRPQLPEDHIMSSDLVHKYSIGKGTVKAVIDELADQIGEVLEYRRGKIKQPGYSPVQRAVIEQRLTERNLIFGLAPDGYLSLSALGIRESITRPVLKRAIDALADELGELEIYRSGPKRVPHLSPKQIEMVISCAKDI